MCISSLHFYSRSQFLFGNIEDFQKREVAESCQPDQLFNLWQKKKKMTVNHICLNGLLCRTENHSALIRALEILKRLLTKIFIVPYLHLWRDSWRDICFSNVYVADLYLPHPENTFPNNLRVYFIRNDK